MYVRTYSSYLFQIYPICQKYVEVSEWKWEAERSPPVQHHDQQQQLLQQQHVQQQAEQIRLLQHQQQQHQQHVFYVPAARPAFVTPRFGSPSTRRCSSAPDPRMYTCEDMEKSSKDQLGTIMGGGSFTATSFSVEGRETYVQAATRDAPPTQRGLVSLKVTSATAAQQLQTPSIQTVFGLEKGCLWVAVVTTLLGNLLFKPYPPPR